MAEPVAFELVWRRPADLSTLELLACALQEAGESVTISAADGVARGEGDPPVACWVRVVVIGGGPIPAQETRVRAAIEDRIEAGTESPIPVELEECDLALVSGPARARTLLPCIAGQVVACGVVRLDRVLDDAGSPPLASEELLPPGPALPRVVEALLGALARAREEEAGEASDAELFDAVRAEVAFGDAEGAVARLERHLQWRPGVEGYRLLAALERARSEGAAACRAIERAESLANAELARVLCERGRLEADLGSPEGARTAFARALDLDSRSADAHTGLGSLALFAGDAEAGETHFRASLELEKSARAWCGLGLALVGRQRPEPASGAFERALELDGELVQALYGLVQAGFARGDVSAAAQRVAEFLEVHPGNLDLWFTLAGLRSELGDAEGARDALERIRVFDPDYPGIAELGAKLDGPPAAR